MWLLDTATAELHYFHSPERVPSPYAILSHVWGKDEQTFQEVKAIGERCKTSGENPRDKVSEKIRRCCEIAEGESYKWVWNDTCCIDKTSSAELSEAINSMFRYYTLSAVCFVYLHHVNNMSDLRPQRSSWFSSQRCFQWTRRGWTLQELIAPTVVILLSHSWTPIGSKYDLADELEELTEIPASLLRHETHLSDYSVAQRMSWAAGRETTRIEDEAYCLLGIFDITMPTLYGEGRRAFRRLQEEIMRTIPDTTLFAWGRGTTCLSDNDTNKYSLLAHAPSDFRGCSDVVHSPRSNDPDASMSFMITPHGILARVPLLVFEEKTFIDLSCTEGPVPILLRVEQSTKDSVYFVIGDLTSRSRFWKLVNTSARPLPSGRMTNIYLASHTSGPRSPTTDRPIGFPCNGNPQAPFHFSITANISRLCTDAETVCAAQKLDASWRGSPPAAIDIDLPHGKTLFPIICGVCTAQTLPVESLPESSSYIHWARVPWFYYRPQGRDHSALDKHDCTTDHIVNWPDGKRVIWGSYDTLWEKGITWEVELSFVKSKLYPNTLVLCPVTWRRDVSASIKRHNHPLRATLPPTTRPRP